MGLASSQARMLLLTARKSDLEYRAQAISQRKINLAMQTEQLANDYSNSMQNMTMKLNYATVNGQAQYEKLSYAGITAENANYVGDYIVKTATGKYAVTDTLDALKVAVKVMNANGGYTTQQKAYGIVAGEGDNKVSVKNYNNIAASNDYMLQNKEGAFTVASQDDAIRHILKTTNDNRDITTLTDAQKQELLTANEGKYVVNEKIADAKYFQNALTNGQVVIAKAQYETTQNADGTEQKTLTGYEQLKGQAQYAEIGTEDVQKQYDLSSMTAEQKQLLLSEFRKTYGEFAVISEMNNADYFQDALRNGGLFLQKNEQTTGTDENGETINITTGYKTVSWSSCGVIAETYKTEDDAQAQADYESRTTVLANQDKLLDLELNKIETQHKAIETEYDSVKKVIQKNIEKSYKIFA